MVLKDFLEEATIMKDMKHPNLVQLLGEWSGVARYVLCITETMNGNNMSCFA